MLRYNRETESGTAHWLYINPGGDDVSEDANPDVYPNASTIYHLTVTDELGVVVQKRVNGTVHTIPEVDCPSNRTFTLNAASFDLIGGVPAGEAPLQQIRIINMLEQTVYAEHIDHISSYRIDIYNIPPGLYVVQVHSFTGWHSTKVQVVR